MKKMRLTQTEKPMLHTMTTRFVIGMGVVTRYVGKPSSGMDGINELPRINSNSRARAARAGQGQLERKSG